MLKITLLFLGLAVSCSQVFSQESTTSSTSKTNGTIKKGERTEVKQVKTNPVKAEMATATAKVPYTFNEKEFVEEYLIGTSLPMGFPNFKSYKDTDAFQRDLKKWIYENPTLVKEEKRIY